MALTDEQLDDIKVRMEAGKPLVVMARDEYPDERPADIRRQMFERFTRETIQSIIQTKIMPNMAIVGIDRVITRNIARDDITVEQIDALIGTLQDGIVSLNIRKAEIQ